METMASSSTLLLLNWLIIATLGAEELTVVMVEYQPVQNSSLEVEDRLNANAANYIKILSGVKKPVDLIIYPEATLGSGAREKAITYATITELGATPCKNESYLKYMQDISCAAQAHDTYVVINTVGKSECDKDKYSERSRNCKETGYFIYNTDVIFDNNGAIAQTYHKYNLFGEFDMDRPLQPDKRVFEVKGRDQFGTFTCFDLLFKTPTQAMVEEGVKSFVMPTMWFGELPFLTALQAQQMWAESHDVRLFSAGANNPKIGSGGTGAYDGASGPAVFDCLTDSTWKALTHTYTPSSPSVIHQSAPEDDDDDIDAMAKKMDGFYLKIEPNLAQYTFVTLDSALDQATGMAQAHLCHDPICCDFNIKLTKQAAQKSAYTYLLVAFSGVRSYTGVYNGGTDVCGVIACLGTTMDTCGQRFPKYEDVEWPTTFDSIAIKATIPTSSNRTQYPNSLLSSVRPLSPADTKWTRREIDSGTKVEVTYESTKPQDRLLTFAVYGRNFEVDNDPFAPNGSGRFKGLSLMAVACLLTLLKLYV